MCVKQVFLYRGGRLLHLASCCCMSQEFVPLHPWVMFIVYGYPLYCWWAFVLRPNTRLAINKAAVNVFYGKICWDLSVSGTTKCKYPVNSCLCGFGVKKQYINRRQRFGGYGIEGVVKTMRSSGRRHIREEPKIEVALPFGVRSSHHPQISFFSSQSFAPQAALTLPPLCFMAPAFFESWLKTNPIHTPQPVLTSLVPTLPQSLGVNAHLCVVRPQHSMQAMHTEDLIFPTSPIALLRENVFFCPSRSSKWPIVSFLSPASDLLCSEFGTKIPLHPNWLLWLFSSMYYPI